MAAPAGRLEEWLLGLGRANTQREYFLTDVVVGAVKAGHPVAAIPVPDAVEVMGVNDRIQLAEVEAGYRRLRTLELMLAGATLADPLRVDVRGTVTVERDVFIDVNAVLVGRVHLGNRVKIGPNCLICNSVIGSGSEINGNCVIDQAVVGENCRVGPFARLRPDTVLDRDVHVGNFVEVKNSRIGAGSKVNHLSYVGDTTVGESVNIGAGTITCNYDGANKWPTVIGDGAFIGSGSMLVAPVRIGAGATIGAGSTITESTADGKLTFTRARQTTIDHWTRTGALTESEKQAVIDEALNPKKT
jgi:bifunctional UDP-N-acetylglucosamine pyrophosphorylase/glucosamine-1-phosphate N-acetyltransferase